MSYADQWDHLKRKFEQETHQERPKILKDTIFGTVQKATGITPVLKDVDAAIAKKQRTPLAQAINKFMLVREPYSMMLTQQVGHLMGVDDDLQMAYAELNSGLQKIAADVSKELKELQEKKAPGKVGVEIIEIDGDLKNTIATAKKNLAAFAALEKKYKVLAVADAALKETDKYTKAAAKSEYQTAINALKEFKKAAAKAATDLDKPIAAEKANANFVKAVQTFQTGMKQFSTVQRVDGQVAALEKAKNTAVY